MHINEIAIFNAAGERRGVPLMRGLNIVTGWSKTGKSSLLHIAEFCFGREHPTYPVGVLTRTVAWFGIEIEHAGRRIVVARPALEPGLASVTNALILHGARLAELGPTELVPNADASAVRDEVSRSLGIEENFMTAGTLMRPPLRATASQALLLCFQGQSEIANGEQLFHRTNDDEVFKALRDTLPYWVGAVDVDTVALRRQLEERRRDLRVATAKLERARGLSRASISGASELAAEAAVLGIVEIGEELDPTEQLRLVAAAPGEITGEPADSISPIESLAARHRALTAQLGQLEHRLRIFRRSDSETRDFAHELAEQQNRLRAIELVAHPLDDSGDSCPLCGSALHDSDPSAASIAEMLGEFTMRLESVREAQPQSARLRGELESQIGDVREELLAVSRDLQAAERQSDELAASADLRQRQAFMRGRIAEFVGGLAESDELTRLEYEVELVEREVGELLERTELVDARERTDSILRVISQDATALSRRLQLEHSENAINIDAQKLSLVADTRDGPVELRRMGSAANLIGYHVATHLALHRWFVEHARPVPSFLFLDQPSQAFFPEDVLSDADEDLADEDHEQVVRLYELINDVVGELDDELQVIVSDHANLNLDWFQQAVAANWRHGEALVPAEWLAE